MRPQSDHGCRGVAMSTLTAISKSSFKMRQSRSVISSSFCSSRLGSGAPTEEGGGREGDAEGQSGCRCGQGVSAVPVQMGMGPRARQRHPVRPPFHEQATVGRVTNRSSHGRQTRS